MKDMVAPPNLAILALGRKDSAFGEIHPLRLGAFELLVFDESLDDSVENIRGILQSVHHLTPMRQDRRRCGVRHYSLPMACFMARSLWCCFLFTDKRSENAPSRGL